MKNKEKKNYIETFVFLFFFLFIIIFVSNKMGFTNFISTIMNTAYSLLINVCLYIMAIAVVTGALSKLLSEFGVISILNKVLSFFMKPLYNLPGASAIGILSCYISDNPAVLVLTQDNTFLSYFKKYQLPAITNLATSFGMGLIITTTIMGMNVKGSVEAAIVGNIGAIIGSIVSVRLMTKFTKKYYGNNSNDPVINYNSNIDKEKNTKERENIFTRIMNSLLEGGKSGVKLGVDIIPGVVIISTIIIILNNGPNPEGIYTGAANEGIGLIPLIGDKLKFLLVPLFGFSNSSALAVPLTALGSAGASIALIPEMIKNNLVSAHDLAVFTSICMCWSGYLSTHIAMMDTLNASDLVNKALISHTIGGIVAGFSSNLIFNFIL